jgi:signal transduction histidine kinase
VLQVARVERETRIAKERAERIAAFRERGIAALQKEFGKAADAIIRAAAEASEQRQAEAVGDLGATGERLRDVLGRMRRASEILTGLIDPEPRRVRAVRIGSAAIERIKAMLGDDAANRIEVSAGLGDVEIMCDPPLAAEALSSVLENALLFSHGMVRLSVVSAPPDRVRFEVQDSGRGIPEYMLDVGFEAFRPGGPHSDDRLHLGLGIPTAKALVEQQGGYFGLMSELGRGTEAFLSFPAARDSERRLTGRLSILTESLADPANLPIT